MSKYRYVVCVFILSVNRSVRLLNIANLQWWVGHSLCDMKNDWHSQPSTSWTRARRVLLFALSKKRKIASVILPRFCRMRWIMHLMHGTWSESVARCSMHDSAICYTVHRLAIVRCAPFIMEWVVGISLSVSVDLQ